jgi:DNA-binding CsgD family transcriptional regulator
MFDTSRLLADLEIHILNDEYEAAARVARHGAVWARSHQMPIDEAFLLEAEFRVAPSVVLIHRLSEIAEDTGSALVSAVAEAADAQLSDRPFDLLRVSRLFEEMPSWWRATACASAAARSFSRAGQPKECRQATLTAQRCAHKSEGADRLIDAELESPLTLTRREWEIASAAAAGQSNQEIAERLFVSRRTVESHLQHVYVKLGVTNRVALAEALPSAKSP